MRTYETPVVEKIGFAVKETIANVIEEDAGNVFASLPPQP